MNQQSYFAETYIPQTETLNQLKLDLETSEQKYQFCEQIKNELFRTVEFMNASKTEYNISLEKQNKTLALTLGGLMIIGMGVVFSVIYRRTRKNLQW